MSRLTTSVSSSAQHGVGKHIQPAITLVAGLGVEGDAHMGTAVKHRSRVRKHPDQPNLRQSHLVAEELHDELVAGGFDVGPVVMGENVTTRVVDLIGLPRATRLKLGADAVVELTGLRNPSKQLEALGRGLMAACLDRDEADSSAGSA